MAKFKVGDMIVINDSGNYTYTKPGSIGVIHAHLSSGYYIVKFLTLTGPKPEWTNDYTFDISARNMDLFDGIFENTTPVCLKIRQMEKRRKNKTTIQDPVLCQDLTL